jgi:hypothetical protein
VKRKKKETRYHTMCWGWGGHFLASDSSILRPGHISRSELGGGGGGVGNRLI